MEKKDIIDIYIDNEKKIIYGKIKDLEPGDYRLMITEFNDDGQRIIDELYFYIYSDDRDMD